MHFFTDSLLHSLPVHCSLRTVHCSLTTRSSPHPLAQLALGGFFHEVEGQQSKSNQDGVTDPRIEPRQAEFVQDMGVVDEVPEVEVEQVKAVAGLAHKDQRAEAEGAGKRVIAGQAKDDATEEGHEQAVVDYWVGNAGSQPEQEEDGGEPADS